MSKLKSAYIPEPGDIFYGKVGYFDIYHSLELDEVQSVIQEREVIGICIYNGLDKHHRQVIKFIELSKDGKESRQGHIREIDIDFYDFSEFEKIS